MMDYIKAFPSVTIEDYMWKLSVPFIRISSSDTTHVCYLTEKQAQLMRAKKYDGNNLSELSDLGVPIFGIDNNN